MNEGRRGSARNIRSTHVWKETTPDGQRREVRAVKFGGAFRLQAKLRDEVAWTYYEVPLIDDIKELREILFRKYQRRRAPYEDLVLIEEMIKRRERE